MGGFGKGSNTTTTSQAPDPQAAAAYRDLLTRASGVANIPFQSYSGELVAPFNAQQNLGVANVNQYSNFAQPYIQQAAQYANNAAQPLTADQIQRYSNPFTNQVVQATQNQFNEQNAQQQSQLLGNAIARGSLGGNRQGVAQSELVRQQQLSQAPVIAGLMSQGYQTGLSTALAQQQAQQQAAYSLGNLGVAGQNAALTGASAQFGVGAQQQATQQAQDTARYNQFLMQQAYPFQTTQWLAGLSTGVGSQLGGTGQTTGPAPNTAAQWGGLGLAALGMFLNKGGRVKGYDEGGPVAGVAGVPYHGVPGYVPGVGITPGHLPAPPKLPAQQAQMDPLKLAQSLGTVGDKVGDRLRAGFEPTMGSPGVEDPIYMLGSHGDYAVPTFVARGGFVPHPQHFDLGGSVEDLVYRPEATSAMPRDLLYRPEYDKAEVTPASYWTGSVQPSAGFESRPEMSPLMFSPPTAPSPGFAPQDVSRETVQEVAADQPSPLDAAEWPQGPLGAPPDVSAHPRGAVPRGIRNNNPGNLEDTPFTRSQPGYIGTDGRFAIFETPEAGQLAASNLLGVYGTKGFNTINSIVNRWAPASDRNDVGAYVAAVARDTGLDPNQPLDMADPNVRQKIAQAMFKHENGQYVTPPNMVASTLPQDQDTVPERATPTAGLAPLEEKPQRPNFGIPGLGNLLGLSPEAKTALMAAGFGIMASKSPFLGTAIGEGALQGLGTYSGLKAAQQKSMLETKRVDLETKRLADAATRAQRQLTETERHNKAVEAQNKYKYIGLNDDGLPIYQDTKTGEEILGKTKVQGKVPPGYVKNPDGSMTYIVGGPADPKVVQGLAKAKQGDLMSDEAAELLAERVIAGDNTALQNLGRGAQAGQNISKVQELVAKKMAATGKSISEQAREIIIAASNRLGINSSQRVLGARNANVGLAVTEAQALMPQVLKTSEAVDRTRFPALNAIILAGERGTGDENVVRFGIAVNSLINVYARAISPTGSPTVSDKDHARELLSTAWSKGQVNAAIDQLKQEMEAALKSPEVAKKHVEDLYRVKPPDHTTPAGTTTAPPAATAAPQSPQRPQTVPAGSAYNAFRKQWRDPNGKVYDADGRPVSP